MSLINVMKLKNNNKNKTKTSDQHYNRNLIPQICAHSVIKALPTILCSHTVLTQTTEHTQASQLLNTLISLISRLVVCLFWIAES